MGCLPSDGNTGAPVQEKRISQTDTVHRDTLHSPSEATVTPPGPDSAAERSTPSTGIAKKAFSFSYHLEEPDRKIKLPGKLREISGLSHFDSHLLATINDEEGVIFIFDLEKGEVVREKEFEKDGDYEGIEVVGKTAFVLRSDGNLFEVIDFLGPEPRVHAYETLLRSKNDAEGLAYDPQTQRLLIACKASPELKGGPEYKRSRAVYAFDLKERRLAEDPFFLINQDTLSQRLGEGALTDLAKEIIRTIDDDVTFRPSGIARHPLTGDYYLIAATGKLLVVLSPAGQLLHVEKLQTTVFKHPEGICFAPDGTLYISNEGGDGRGNILEFGYGRP